MKRHIQQPPMLTKCKLFQPQPMKSNMIPLFSYRILIFFATKTSGKRYETQDNPCVKRKNEATELGQQILF
jgi:hypothetical protein